jgi:hypothetical protein
MIKRRTMTSEVSGSNVKELASKGTKAFVRFFACLTLQVLGPNKASWNFRFQIRSKRVKMKLGMWGESTDGLW